MAPIVLTAAEALAALELGSSDLKFLLEKHGVDNDLQSLLFHVGTRAVPVLALVHQRPNESRTLSL